MNSLFHLAAPEWSHSKDVERLKALSDCGIFATMPESDFDDLVKVAAMSCQCASAMIAFADSEHLHFKSTTGASKPLLKSVADSFFIPTVQKSAYVWSSSSPVTSPTDTSVDYSINFFAGVPIRANSGQIIGMLCVTDPKAHALSTFQNEALIALGRQTERQLILRRMIVDQDEMIKLREQDIETRRLSEAELASALNRASLIYDIGKAARSGADPDAILSETVTKLGIALNADRCYFISYNADESVATIGPDWHVDGLGPISGTYESVKVSTIGVGSNQLLHVSTVDDGSDNQLTTELDALSSLGLKSILRAPVVRNKGLTALGVAMATPRIWTSNEIMLVEAIAAQARAAVETARHILREREMLRDVLASVTEGKLLLADTPTQFPNRLSPVGGPVLLDSECGLAELRELIRFAGRKAHHTDIRTFDSLTAASEAGMNAIVHAGHGVATVFVGDEGTLQVCIEDQGKGIKFDDLPKAALSRGYSTKSTFGHGLKMMLETIDRLYLLTGPAGTTVVLEQHREVPEPQWMSLQSLAQ